MEKLIKIKIEMDRGMWTNIEQYENLLQWY